MKLLFVMGTRPEAIKLAPVIKEAREQGFFEVEICSTGQHRELLDQVTDFFCIKKDYNLDLMMENQTLGGFASQVISRLSEVYETSKPDCVVVQGDTTTAMAGAFASFYKKIKIAHVEAGLRSGDKFSPFPEEMNRSIISKIADFHFCPTERNKQNLEKENIRENVYVVGNTVIDALRQISSAQKEPPEGVAKIDFSKKTVLITMHRRESFGEPIKEVFSALHELSNRHADIRFIFLLHPNPNIMESIFQYSKSNSTSPYDWSNFHLIYSLDYPSLVWVLRNCFAVMTDSGGLQEEAPFFRKPVLVMRNVTERQEGIGAGVSLLVGQDYDRIVTAFESLLDSATYERMSKPVNLYGDGNASSRIHEVLKKNI